MPTTCHACGAAYSRRGSPGFREECSGCETPLHCCANCRFYEAEPQQWCREPQARDARPREPIISNLCDYFVFATERAEGGARADEAKEKLATLFGETVDDPASTATPDWMKVDKPPQKDIFGNDIS